MIEPATNSNVPINTRVGKLVAVFGSLPPRAFDPFLSPPSFDATFDDPVFDGLSLPLLSPLPLVPPVPSAPFGPFGPAGPAGPCRFAIFTQPSAVFSYTSPVFVSKYKSPT